MANYKPSFFYNNPNNRLQFSDLISKKKAKEVENTINNFLKEPEDSKRREELIEKVNFLCKEGKSLKNGELGKEAKEYFKTLNLKEYKGTEKNFSKTCHNLMVSVRPYAETKSSGFFSSRSYDSGKIVEVIASVWAAAVDYKKQCNKEVMSNNRDPQSLQGNDFSGSESTSLTRMVP